MKNSIQKLLVVLGMLVMFMLVACGGSTQVSPQPAAPASEVTQVTPPQATHHPPTVGQPYDVGDGFIVTINSVHTSMGIQYFAPKDGYRYVVVNVTVENVSGEDRIVSSLGMFAIRDITGQSYTETFFSGAKSPPDGTVHDGSHITGELAYEIPLDQSHLVIQFSAVFGTAGFTEWPLTVN